MSGLFLTVLGCLVILSPVFGEPDPIPEARTTPPPDVAAVLSTSTAISPERGTPPLGREVPLSTPLQVTTSPRSQGSGGIELTVDDCVRMGVSANLTLLRKGLERDANKFDIDIARRVFIPEASAQVTESRDAARSRLYQQGLAVTGVQGTKVGVRNEYRDSLATKGRDEKTQVFTLTQPLMKNFGRAVTGYELDVARIAYAAGVEKFRSDLNSFIFDLVTLCLDLSFARKNLAIQEAACERARRQFEDTRHDIDLGAIAEREIFLVEENLVGFEIKRQNARQEIALLELQLRQALNFDPTLEGGISVADALGGEDPSPLSSPRGRGEETASSTGNPTRKPREETGLVAGATNEWVGSGVTPASFAEVLAVARRESPDLQLDRLLLKKSLTAFERERIQYNPRLDFTLDYRWREGSTARANAYTVGMQYEVPLSRTADRADLGKARLDNEIKRLAIQDTETRLAYRLREVLLQIDHLTQVLGRKHRSVELSQKTLEAENEKYKNGYSTLADVVRFQRELESAQIDELSTRTSLYKFRLRRFLLEGTLHRQFGITVGA